MKLRGIFVSALLLAAVTLSSCAVSLTEKDGALYDKKNGITYVAAPLCYEPQKTLDEVYAKCGKLKLELYEIDGLDPDEWLSEKYEGIGGVWHSDGAELPDIDGFDADRMYICVEQTKTISLATVEDKEVIDALVKVFVDGETSSLVQNGESYKLKFESEKYPGLYYNLLYVIGPDGKNYVYDRETKRCVNVGDILKDYVS